MFNRNYGKVINNSERQINKFVPKILFNGGKNKIVKKSFIFLNKNAENENKEDTDNEDKEKNEI